MINKPIFNKPSNVLNRKNMNKTKISTMFARWQQQNPKPTTELNYENVYQLLVAVILSAQSTDKSVNMVTKPLFDQVKSAQDMLKINLPTLTQALNRLGLHQQKAKFILAMSQILVEQHAGAVPGDRAALEALPGVGRKTANVVLNTAFGQAVIAVDTHIFRVAKRIGLSKGSNPRQVEDDLERVIPKNYLLDAHHWLILHGRYVCQARKPRCHDCVISDLCEFKQKTTE
jgi:endonuclease-3